MLISKREAQRFLERRLESHAWIKRAPRADLIAACRGLPVRPVFRTAPWLHQLVCFYLAMCYPRFQFLLDMGLGKTKIVLDVITQLIREKKIRRALVMVPRKINMAGWLEAAAEHSDLEAYAVMVEDIEAKREALLHPKGEITIVDYQGLTLACTKKEGKKGLVKDPALIRKVRSNFDLLDLDESHKLGNAESLWFSIVKDIADAVAFCYGNTGTPAGKDMMALWAQYRIVDGGETFGTGSALFKSAFFTASIHDFKGEVLTFDRGKASRLHQMMGHRAIRYGYDDVPELDMPTMVVRRTLLRMGEDQREHYLLALQNLINANGELKETKAQWFRMRQITSGYIQWSDDLGKHEQVFDFNPKLLELERLVDEAGDQKLVISCEYTRTGALICEMLERIKVPHVWLYGGSRDPVAVARKFREDPDCRVLVMNSDAGGTGVDGLQKVCRTLVLYETPSNPTPRSQVVKRVHRPGQTRRTFIIDLAMERTVDVGILDDLAAGRDLFDAVINGKKDPRCLF